MSSMIRRMEIRRMKKIGFVRSKFAFRRDKDGKLQRVFARRGGMILNPDGDAIGYNWPKRVKIG